MEAVMPEDTVTSVHPIPHSISCAEVAPLMASPLAPLLLDARSDEAFLRDDRMLPGALRMSVERARELAQIGQCAVVVYCARGHEKSQEPATALARCGLSAHYLEGGLEAWQRAGFATMRKRADLHVPSDAGSLWVTRARPKIDRIACPWLIRRFIDPRARFLYVPTAEVFAVAERERAVAFDIPGAPIEHDGPRCSFDSLLAAFDLHDPYLDALAPIVRGADTGHAELAPECAGLLAVSRGLSANYLDDHAMLEQGMVVYDALYASLRTMRSQSPAREPRP